LFDVPGCKGIILWGLAYASMYKTYALSPMISFVFAVEKLYYGQRWVSWIMKNHNKVEEMKKKDYLTGRFFEVYGILDISSMFFFLYVGFKHI